MSLHFEIWLHLLDGIKKMQWNLTHLLFGVQPPPPPHTHTRTSLQVWTHLQYIFAVKSDPPLLIFDVQPSPHPHPPHCELYLQCSFTVKSDSICLVPPPPPNPTPRNSPSIYLHSQIWPCLLFGVQKTPCLYTTLHSWTVNLLSMSVLFLCGFVLYVWYWHHVWPLHHTFLNCQSFIHVEMDSVLVCNLQLVLALCFTFALHTLKLSIFYMCRNGFCVGV